MPKRNSKIVPFLLSLFQSFSCSPTAEKPGVLKETVIAEIAARHGKSVPQILIRYCIDRGVIVIPKSITPKWIEQNLQVRTVFKSPRFSDNGLK